MNEETIEKIHELRKRILKSLSRHEDWTYGDIEADIDEEVDRYIDSIK